MREWFARFRAARGVEWTIAAILLGAIVLLLTRGIASGASTEYERRLERLLGGIEGVGDVRVMVETGAEDSLGVVVVCEGGADMRVALEVARAVRTITGARADRIEVMAMRGD